MIKEIDIKIVITDDELKENDLYWSPYHKLILRVVNEYHAMGLNMINKNEYGTNKPDDFNYKVINYK